MKTSVDRFKAHYGPEPRSVKDLMSDLCHKFPDTSFEELLMGLNWLKLYDIELSNGTMMNQYAETNVAKLPVELCPSEKD